MLIVYLSIDTFRRTDVSLKIQNQSKMNQYIISIECFLDEQVQCWGVFETSSQILLIEHFLYWGTWCTLNGNLKKKKGVMVCIKCNLISL